MITAFNQRWRNGRASYRPAGETINVAAFEVAPIADDTTAKAFVTAHHYSGSFPAARFRYGLYRRSELVGVAVFSVAWKHVLEPLFPGQSRDSVELGRFVLLDNVAANGETWFLARCFESLRVEGLAGVVSFSDPVPRAAADGRVVFPGHVGTIYQAFNARYLGRSKAETKWLLPDGKIFEHRNCTKIRNLARGWRYAVAMLEAVGAPRFEQADHAAWLASSLERIGRKFRHAGNHRYAWGLNRRVQRNMPESQAYPKFTHRLTIAA